MMYAGSFAEPFGTVPVVFGVWPLTSATAACAATFASFRVSFQTVIVCHPLMMFWKPCGVVVPRRHELIRAFLEGAVRIERLQDGVVPALEEERVRVGAAAVDLGDDRVLRVLPVRLQAVDDAVALQDTDCPTVERDVDRRDAALDLAVVVDRRDPLCLGGLLDCRRGTRVDRDLDDDLRARGEALISLGLLLLGITAGVVDLGGDTCLLQFGLEGRCVVVHPPDRGGGVWEQRADLSACCLFGRARRGGCGDERRDADGNEGDHNHRPVEDLLQVRLLNLADGRPVTSQVPRFWAWSQVVSS